MDDRIESSRAPEPVGLYPHARRVGNLLFLSGVGPRELGTKIIPGVELNQAGEIVSYDIEPNAARSFKMCVTSSRIRVRPGRISSTLQFF
jgi:2-aminomuconate deaminase